MEGITLPARASGMVEGHDETIECRSVVTRGRRAEVAGAHFDFGEHRHRPRLEHQNRRARVDCSLHVGPCRFVSPRADLVREHDRIVRGRIEAHAGHGIKHTGDGIMACFDTPSVAVAAAVQMQQELAERNGRAHTTVNVRIGISAGEPLSEGDDLFGSDGRGQGDDGDSVGELTDDPGRSVEQPQRQRCERLPVTRRDAE